MECSSLTNILVKENYQYKIYTELKVSILFLKLNSGNYFIYINFIFHKTIYWKISTMV